MHISLKPAFLPFPSPPAARVSPPLSREPQCLLALVLSAARATATVSGSGSLNAGFVVSSGKLSQSVMAARRRWLCSHKHLRSRAFFAEIIG